MNKPIANELLQAALFLTNKSTDIDYQLASIRLMKCALTLDKSVMKTDEYTQWVLHDSVKKLLFNRSYDNLVDAVLDDVNLREQRVVESTPSHTPTTMKPSDITATLPPALREEAPIMNLSDLPTLGQPLAGGIFAGLTTTPTGEHHAVVLTPDLPAPRMPWKDAMQWAASLGDSASLPTRPVSALLFANVRDQIEPNWYWTSESFKDDNSYAWFQVFGYGGQSYTPKSYEGQARAVRLIHLTT